MHPEPINLLGLDAPALTQLVGQWGGKPFRARQLQKWVHQRNTSQFEEMTDLARESGDMVAMIKYLLQSGQKPGTASPYIYTLLKATTKADLKPDTCWDLKALQAAAGN